MSLLLLLLLMTTAVGAVAAAVLFGFVIGFRFCWVVEKNRSKAAEKHKRKQAEETRQ